MKKVLFGFILFIVISLGVSLYVDSRSTGMFLINTAMKVSSSQEVSASLSYGKQKWQTLDVYPQMKGDKPAPVLVFLHGGGWHWGVKEQYYFAADAFVKLGYTVVVPDYIKFPAGRFPTFIEDGAKAVAWVKDNIAQHNGDPENIFITGHSAGAHSAALLVTDKSYLAEEGLSITDVRGFAGIAGPYNFTPEWPQYVETFGTANYQRMKASSHVDGDEPPMLLIHAKGDTAVGIFNQQTLSDSLISVGSKVETILYGEDVGHIGIMMKVHPWFADNVNVAADIDQFFRPLIK